MTFTLFEFPPRAEVAPPRLPAQRLSEQEFGLFDIARRLGRGDASVRTLIELVQELIKLKGFPPPKGFRRWKGELLQGWQAVCAKSRWPRAAVEAWLDNTFPQHSAAQEEADQTEWADALDRNAGLVA